MSTVPRGSLRLLRGVATPASVASAAIGGVLGAIISVVVNNALIEISITPFFATVFGFVLVLLGGLMIWRKLWEEDNRDPMTRLMVLAFSALVLLSGIACFLLQGRSAHPLLFLQLLLLLFLLL